MELWEDNLRTLPKRLDLEYEGKKLFIKEHDVFDWVDIPLYDMKAMGIFTSMSTAGCKQKDTSTLLEDNPGAAGLAYRSGCHPRTKLVLQSAIA